MHTLHYSDLALRDFRNRWANRLAMGSKALTVIAIVTLAVVALRQIALMIG